MKTAVVNSLFIAIAESHPLELYGLCSDNGLCDDLYLSSFILSLTIKCTTSLGTPSIYKVFQNFGVKLKCDKKKESWFGDTCSSQLKVQGHTDFL